MINQIGGFEDIVEKGQSSVRKVAKGAKQGAQNFAKTGAGQVSGSQSAQGTNEQASTAAKQQMSDDQAKQFLRDLYGVPNKAQNQQTQSTIPQPANKIPTTVRTAVGMGASQGKAPTPAETVRTAMGIPQSAKKEEKQPDPNPAATALGISAKDPHQGLNPEEIAKLEALREALHKDYYESLTKSNKPQEEHVSERLEREDEKKKMSELEAEKKKPPPLAPTIKQGTGERLPGVSG